ncbi:MAG: hypothetical protein GWN00_08150, partial [Aliifodinibius sp.]|nr:hypothetical protein [Fodinibius sp.]NIY24780.1 hypothetical protein [Fodinibius sp.]
MFETSVPITADLIGPTLGLAADDVYIFWYVIYRTGLEAGFTETRFVTFPSSSPDQISSPERTFIPAEHDLDYEPFPEEAIKVGERYGLENQSFSRVGALQDIHTNLTPEDELAVAFRASIDYYWRRSSNQIAVLYFRDGLPTSYQLLSFTQQPSTDPTVISDANGNLYVSWLERGDAYRFDVFFASTSENLRNAFDPLTTNDIVDLSAATIFGLLTGVLLAPIAAVLFLIL